MKFSFAFGLRKQQPELDFVDVDTAKDLPLFIDPYALARRDDVWSQECASDVASFFQAAVDAIRANDPNRAQRLLNNLSEPNETCLGLSRGHPQGRGVSGKQAFDLYQRLRESEAARSGFLSELAELDLMVDGIGSDKISDITTNIIRSRLIAYTQAQCALHRIALDGTVASGKLWDADRREWTQRYVSLPVIEGRRILLVPKAIIRWEMALQHTDYYRHFVLNYLQQDEIRRGSSLVHLLKSGGVRVYKKDLTEAYPHSKEFLYQFSLEHPEVLDAYKRVKSTLRPEMANDELTEIDPTVLAIGLREQLASIPQGDTGATQYHDLMVGALEFIFYPHLIYPKKEREIHEGRKRIDISYTNNAHQGLFGRVRTAPQIAAQSVMVECKNYSHDPANPELDQLSGRFSPTRGRFGMLLARRFRDKDLFMRRCQDTARDGRGYIVPLADDDVDAMLGMIAQRNWSSIDGYLNSLYTQLLG